jgi:hypothetical protein
MLKTWKDFPKLQFPLYILPSDNWYEADKVLFINNQVVDERNMPGKTLGVRRIQCRRTDLLPLKKAVLDIPGLIQCKTKIFIDNVGEPFLYEKTYNSRLKTYRIKGYEPKNTASLLWLQGCSSPFTIPRPPVGNPGFARVLHYNGEPWLLYDYVRIPQKDTYRRV